MRAGWLLLLVALANGVVFAVSGVGTRFELWDYRVGLEILRGSTAALALGVLALIVLLVHGFARRHGQHSRRAHRQPPAFFGCPCNGCSARACP
jgi:hypothetical protein